MGDGMIMLTLHIRPGPSSEEFAMLWVPALVGGVIALCLSRAKADSSAGGLRHECLVVRLASIGGL